MTLEELRERLGELEETRKLAWAELDAIAARRERLAELERDRDALIEEMEAMVPDALDDLFSEDRNRVYRMLRLSGAPSSFGYEVSGAFCSAECSHLRAPQGGDDLLEAVLGVGKEHHGLVLVVEEGVVHAGEAGA